MQVAWQTLAELFSSNLMCTIAFLVDVIAGAPLVLAANRDELYARPTRPPERLAPGIAGGVDELSGGTWLAVRADGRFAAVTNQRALATPPPGLRSRGLAVKELAAAHDPEAYVESIDPTPAVGRDGRPDVARRSGVGSSGERGANPVRARGIWTASSGPTAVHVCWRTSWNRSAPEDPHRDS